MLLKSCAMPPVAGRFHLLALAQCRLVAQLLGDIDATHDGAAARHLPSIDFVFTAIVRHPHHRHSVGRRGAEIEWPEKGASSRRALGKKLVEGRRRLPDRIPAGDLGKRPIPGDDRS
jgi:hypothetical protein